MLERQTFSSLSKSKEDLSSLWNAMLEISRKSEEILLCSPYMKESSDRLLALLNVDKPIDVKIVTNELSLKTLEAIHRLKKRHNIRVYTVNWLSSDNKLFHPKAYAFRTSDNQWHCFHGSSNLSEGGFGRNYEIMTGEQSTQIPEHVSILRNFIAERAPDSESWISVIATLEELKSKLRFVASSKNARNTFSVQVPWPRELSKQFKKAKVRSEGRMSEAVSQSYNLLAEEPAIELSTISDSDIRIALEKIRDELLKKHDKAKKKWLGKGLVRNLNQGKLPLRLTFEKVWNNYQKNVIDQCRFVGNNYYMIHVDALHNLDDKVLGFVAEFALEKLQEIRYTVTRKPQIRSFVLDTVSALKRRRVISGRIKSELLNQTVEDLLERVADSDRWKRVVDSLEICVHKSLRSGSAMTLKKRERDLGLLPFTGECASPYDLGLIILDIVSSVEGTKQIPPSLKPLSDQANELSALHLLSTFQSTHYIGNDEVKDCLRRKLINRQMDKPDWELLVSLFWAALRTSASNSRASSEAENSVGSQRVA